jgi:hypothetical protein
MNDQKPKGTFAKLMSSTPPLNTQEGHENERLKLNQENASIPENKISRMPDIQHAGKLENQKSGIPESQNTGKSKVTDNTSPTEKVTYRFHPEGKYAVEDMKSILSRKHGIKSSLEEIAEQAILIAYEELLENQNASKLAIRLSRMPENKKAS